MPFMTRCDLCVTYLKYKQYPVNTTYNKPINLEPRYSKDGVHKTKKLTLRGLLSIQIYSKIYS